MKHALMAPSEGFCHAPNSSVRLKNCYKTGSFSLKYEIMELNALISVQ